MILGGSSSILGSSSLPLDPDLILNLELAFSNVPDGYFVTLGNPLVYLVLS
jgi:hypothetical protein